MYPAGHTKNLIPMTSNPLFRRDANGGVDPLVTGFTAHSLDSSSLPSHAWDTSTYETERTNDATDLLSKGKNYPLVYNVPLDRDETPTNLGGGSAYAFTWDARTYDTGAYNGAIASVPDPYATAGMQTYSYPHATGRSATLIGGKLESDGGAARSVSV
jgi:hypothetical protein